MANYDFKNAVVGQKYYLDPSWPSLDEIKGSSKLEVANFFASQKQQNEVDVPKQDENEFPELTQTNTRKRNMQVSRSGPSCSHELPLVQAGKSFKNPKLLHEPISVPLLSLVKIQSIKKKIHMRKDITVYTPLSGNKLDSDRPIRRKGKIRLNKIRESKIKREINLSKKIKHKQTLYNQATNIRNLRTLRNKLQLFLHNSSGPNLSELESRFDTLNIEDQETNRQEKEGKDELSKILNPILEEISEKNTVDLLMHSGSFGRYCNNVVDPSLKFNVEMLIRKLVFLQDRMFLANQAKAIAKRRYVCGLKEAHKNLEYGKVKMVIVATNLPLDLDLPSGRVLGEIKMLTEGRNIPLVFAGKGNEIGYWTVRKRRISAFSVLNYEGLEEVFNRVKESWEDCKRKYEDLSEKLRVCVAYQLPEAYFQQAYCDSVDREGNVNNQEEAHSSQNMESIE